MIGFFLCVDLTELHWITMRSLQSGTPNTLLTPSQVSHSIEFTLLGASSRIYNIQPYLLHSWICLDPVSKSIKNKRNTFRPSPSKEDRAKVTKHCSVIRTCEEQLNDVLTLLHCSETVLGVPIGDQMKTLILIIGRYLLSKFWCQGSQMLFPWFTLVFLEPQLQEGAKM